MKTAKILLFFCFVFSCIHITSAQNYVTTFAGSTSGYVDGDTSEAKFKTPFGLCIDINDNLYLADDDNHCIRKITPDGIVSTYAGTGIAGYADGAALSAQFKSPSDVCIDNDGNIFVSDFENQRIRKIDIFGIVSTVAGSGIEGYVDGNIYEAEFAYPRGIVADNEGNLFIGDSWNHRIRKINLIDGEVTTFAGGGLNTGVSSIGDFIDASDTSARFYTPSGLGIDADKNIYVADAYNHRIRKITPSGLVTTVAGSGDAGPGLGGYSNGAALSSLLNTPTEVFITNDGRIYIGDTFNNRIRLVEGGMLSNIAGNGNSGYVNGIDSVAEFNYTRGVVMDAAGENLFVCDYVNRRIRKITLNYITSVDDLNWDNRLNIYPNPNAGIFTVEFIGSQPELNSMMIYDGLGEIVFEINISNKNMEVFLSELNPGIYYMNLIGDQYIKTKKIVLIE